MRVYNHWHSSAANEGFPPPTDEKSVTILPGAGVPAPGNGPLMLAMFSRYAGNRARSTMTMEIMRATTGPVDIAGQIIQYDYFTEHFGAESFSFLEILIDAERVSCVVDLKSYEATNVSLLLLDRILQSLGFSVSAYLLKREGKAFRFLFIKGLRWDFAGPIRPGRPVRIQSAYTMQFLSPRKAVCTFEGTVNEGKAAFNVAIEIFSSRESPWDIGAARASS